MSDLTKFQPKERFTGLADLYARCRPSYPREAIDHIISHCELQPGDLLVDVGSGTGISARLFAERGLRVLGIEPNAEMRSVAASSNSQDARMQPEYRPGQAESTGLDSNCAQTILSAQAFHWFKSDLALREFYRILRPGGWAVLIWNERDESDEFTAAYGDVVRSFPDPAGVELGRVVAAQAFLDNQLFHDRSKAVFMHGQVMDEDAMLGRAFSASYAPKEPALAKEFALRMREVFATLQQAGKISLRYETSVYSGRKPECGS